MNFLKKNYIFIVPAIAFLVIRLGLNFDGFYGQDSYEYLRYTDALTNYYTSGENPGDYFGQSCIHLFHQFLDYY